MFSAHFIEDFLNFSFLLLFSIVMFTAAIETRVTILLFSLGCLLSVSGVCYLSISEYNSYLIYNLIRGSLWRFIVNYVLTLVLRGVSPLRHKDFYLRPATGTSVQCPVPSPDSVQQLVSVMYSCRCRWQILSHNVCLMFHYITSYMLQVRYKFFNISGMCVVLWVQGAGCLPCCPNKILINYFLHGLLGSPSHESEDCTQIARPWLLHQDTIKVNISSLTLQPHNEVSPSFVWRLLVILVHQMIVRAG